MRPARALPLLFAFWLAAGGTEAAAHSTVFVPIALEDAGDAPPGPGPARVRFGVPLPPDTAAFDPERLVLVGARAQAVRALARWPDGRLRWVGIDAVVEIGAGGRKPALYLAPGRARSASIEAGPSGGRLPLLARALDPSWYNQASALPVRIVAPEEEIRFHRERGLAPPPERPPGAGSPLDDIIEFLRHGGSRGRAHLRAAERAIAAAGAAHAGAGALLRFLLGEPARAEDLPPCDEVGPVAEFLRGAGGAAIERAWRILAAGEARSIAERQALLHLVLHHARPLRLGPAAGAAAGELDHEAYLVASAPPGVRPLVASALVLAAVVSGRRLLGRGAGTGALQSGAAGLLVAFLLAGCEPGAGPGPAPPPPASHPERPLPPRARTDGGSFEVALGLPSPIPLNEHFRVEALVFPARGGELPADVTVRAHADMPEHRHGMPTAPEIRAAGDGRFIARGFLFHMPGRWEIYVDVVQGATVERATFPVEVD